jgi:predicted RNA binding protein YcfA (HicA-like mRNA interferase family)
MLYAHLMPISGKKIVKILRDNGWEIISKKGSHVKLKKGERTTIIPVHGNKDLGKGLIKAIEKQTDEELL